MIAASCLISACRPGTNIGCLPQQTGSNSRFFWLLIVIALAALAWVWWHSDRPVSQENRQPKNPVNIRLRLKTSPPFQNEPPVVIATIATSAASATNFPRPAQNIFEAQLALEVSAFLPVR